MSFRTHHNPGKVGALAGPQYLFLLFFLSLATMLECEAQSGTNAGASEWCVGYGENYRSKSATTVTEVDACTSRCGAKGTGRRTEIAGGCACEVPCPSPKTGGCSYNITKGNCSAPRTIQEPPASPPQRPPGCPPPKTAPATRADGCPDIPGMERTTAKTCKCPGNQVIMMDECGNPACRPWLLPPTRGEPTLYGPDKCPWPDRGNIPACKKYCDECLSSDYGWSVVSEILFMIQAKNDLLLYLTKGGGPGKNGEILSCMRSFLGLIGQTAEGVASNTSGQVSGYINENGASNLAAMACAAKDCLSTITGRDPFATIPGGALWSKALDLVCAAGDHLAQKIRCGTAHLECESTAHGAQPIPQCKGLSRHPLMTSQKRIEPTSACLDCCSAQVLHVFEKCKKNRNDKSCQFYMNLCLETC